MTAEEGVAFSTSGIAIDRLDRLPKTGRIDSGLRGRLFNRVALEEAFLLQQFVIAPTVTIGSVESGFVQQT